MRTPVLLPEGVLLRLSYADPALGQVIRRVGPCTLASRETENPLETLVHSIISQQISGRAATTIYQRFLSIFPVNSTLNASDILDVEDTRLRACGLSGQKVTYLKSLCERISCHQLNLEILADLGDEEIIQQLIQVKGLGRWSAQMFLIFHLGRLDIWPSDDLGVRKGLTQILARDTLIQAAEARGYGERYRPYRSIAAWYLWRAIDEAAS